MSVRIVRINQSFVTDSIIPIILLRRFRRYSLYQGLDKYDGEMGAQFSENSYNALDVGGRL
jgi:hypothetical protein